MNEVLIAALKAAETLVAANVTIITHAQRHVYQEWLHNLLFESEEKYQQQTKGGNLFALASKFLLKGSYKDQAVAEYRRQVHNEGRKKVNAADEAFFLGFFAPPPEVSALLASLILQIAALAGNAPVTARIFPPSPDEKDGFTAIVRYNNPYDQGGKLEIKDVVCVNCEPTSESLQKGVCINNGAEVAQAFVRTSRKEGSVTVTFVKGPSVVLSLYKRPEPVQPAPAVPQEEKQKQKFKAVLECGGTLRSTDPPMMDSSESYMLCMQGDGNLVLYVGKNPHPKNAIWASNTCNKGTPPFRLEMQASDNHLVIYDANNKATWASGTCGKGKLGAWLQLQDDRNLVIYDGDTKAIWATGTQL